MPIRTNPIKAKASIPANSFAVKTKSSSSSSGVFTFLRIFEGVLIGIASIVAPETLPALVGLAALDIGSNLAIDLVEESAGVKTDMWGNLIVNTFANAIPFVSTAKTIAREAALVENTSKALEQFKDIRILKSGTSESLKLLKNDSIDVDLYKSLSRNEQQKLFKDVKSIRNNLASGLLEQAGRTNNIERLTQIAKPLELLGVVGDNAVSSTGKLQLGRNFLLKNDSLFEDILEGAKTDALKDLDEFGDNTFADANLQFLNTQGRIIGSQTLLSNSDTLKRTTLWSQLKSDAKNSPRRIWDYITWKETRDWVKGASKYSDLNVGQKFVKYFSSEAGYKATQRIQLFNANDFARETINRPLSYLRKLVVKNGTKMREFWESKFGIGKLDKFAKAWQRNMIPFADSSWLLGARVIKQDPAGLLNHLVVFHKNPKYKPVFIKGVPKEIVLQFLTAPSKGAAYHKLFAWSKNGQDIIRLGYASGALFAALPLNALRNILSTATNLKGVAQFAAKNGGDFAKAYTRKYIETIENNAPARVARYFTTYLFGGSGIISQQAGKFASALVKSYKGNSFNGKPLLTALATSVRTGVIKQTQRRNIGTARMRRVSKRYLGRLKGVQSLTGLRSPRNK